MIMVSVCLPFDALSQHLPSYLGFSYLGRGVSLHGYSSKAQPHVKGAAVAWAQEGLEELFHVQGHEGQWSGDTPRPR